MLGDLGFAIKLDEITKENMYCGTLPYFPPEMLREEYCGVESDFFSLGVLM